MGDVLDLFGDPVPANHGGRGRPAHIPTLENRNRVKLLLALGWSNERIAARLDVTLPTLRKHYFSELKVRSVMRDRLDARLLERSWQLVEAGKISAVSMFLKLLERNDLMNFGQATKPAADQGAAAPAETPAAKLGKKEAALLAAQTPDVGSTLGELMARRQQSTH